MKKITVIESACISCGACQAISGENFIINDAGIAEVISQEITEDTMDAVEGCPTSAIIIEEN